MSYNSQEKQGGLPKPLIIGGLVALIVIALVISYQFMPKSGGVTQPDSPDVLWVKKRSKEVGGDYKKLTPDEQKRVDKITNNHGAMSVGIYGKAQ